jgi:hypothetical protein
VEDGVFEPDATLRPERRVLRVVPVEVLHRLQDSTMCAHQAHVGVGRYVPKSVPKCVPNHDAAQPGRLSKGAAWRKPLKRFAKALDRPVGGTPVEAIISLDRDR